MAQTKNEKITKFQGEGILDRVDLITDEEALVLRTEEGIINLTELISRLEGHAVKISFSKLEDEEIPLVDSSDIEEEDE